MARSDPHDEEFSDLYLSDFVLAHKRVARRKLERLALDPFLSGLVSRGVQPHMDRMEPLDLVLEASIGYLGAIGVALLDKVASVHEKVDMLVLDAKTMRDSRMDNVEEMQAMSRRISNDREDWMRRFVEESWMRRDLARDHNELKSLCNSLVAEVGRLTDDLGSLRQRFSRSLPRAAPLVDSARMAAEPIHMLIRHEGRLVEIGEVDRAEDEVVLDSTRGSPARDFLAEEEEQAQEAQWNNELTFHAEVEAARADPSPQYEDPPVYD